MTADPSRRKLIAWIVCSWLASHITLIAGHVLTVFVYSLAVAPGLTPADYTAFAERSGPWFSILAGGPVFYLVGRLLRRSVRPRRRMAGLAVWGLYSATDLAVTLAFAPALTPLLAAQWVASQGIKLIAVLLGTRSPAEDSGP